MFIFGFIIESWIYIFEEQFNRFLYFVLVNEYFENPVSYKYVDGNGKSTRIACRAKDGYSAIRMPQKSVKIYVYI